MYHHVSDSTPPATSVSPATFRAQLDYLADHGFRVWPLTAIVDSLRSGGALPDSVVALTFDDGYRSVYTAAFPLLRERSWPFTVFVTPEAIDQHQGPVLTWDQLREMAAAGAEVGSHGLRHDHLPRRLGQETAAAWRDRVAAELHRARERIEREIGVATDLIAYPFGEYDTDLRRLVRAAGWVAFGQQSGPLGSTPDLTALPRYPMAAGYADLADFGLKAGSLPFTVVSCDPEEPRLEPKPGAEPRPVLHLVLGAGDFRPEQLAAFASGQGAADLQRSGGRPLELTLQARQPLGAGRSRYNLTAPCRCGERWYWYSHPWILGDEHED